MTGRIFINYRRGDSQAAAGRLYDRLLQHFERDQLFMDVDAIEPGVDFVKSLDEQVSTCSAFITVIGPGWLAARKSDGGPRLDDPTDHVRVEIESALKRDIRVIPVLVDGASMPRPSDLPPSIEALARRNAMEIAHHRFTADCDDLAYRIKRALGVATEPLATVQPFVGPSSLQDRAAKKLSWAEILFSFKGRISRMQFLIGFVSVLVVALTFVFAVAFTVDAIFVDSDTQQRKFEIFQKRLATIVEISTSWPFWALILKRLHDFGHGWKTLLFFVACDIAVVALDFLDKDELATPLMTFSLGITFMLAAIKGTSGPNEYGPDPLAKPPSTR